MTSLHPIFEVPVEVAACIVSFLLQDGQLDRKSVKAAATISLEFKAAAVALLYGKLVFDLYDKATDAALHEYVTEVVEHPDTALCVRNMVLEDNVHVHRNGQERQQHILAIDPFGLMTLALEYSSNLTSLTISSTLRTLDWATFSFTVQQALHTIFTSNQLARLSLVGLRNIPLELSSDIFKVENLKFENSQFTAPTHLGALFLPSRPMPPVFSAHMTHRTLTFHSLWDGLTNTPFFCKLPPTQSLSLFIGGVIPSPARVLEVSALLKAAGPQLRDLSISTVGFALSFVKQHPPPDPKTNLRLYMPSARFPHWDSRFHNEIGCIPDELDPLTDRHILPIYRTGPGEAINKGTNPPDSWFADLMLPLTQQIAAGVAPNLRSLKFSVSNWRNTEGAKDNAEMFWALSVLDSLPPRLAAQIQEITFVAHAGTDSCRDNILAIGECLCWKGWELLDAALASPLERCAERWLSLDRVTVEIHSKLRCVYDVVFGAQSPLWQMLYILEHVQLGMLDKNPGVSLTVGYVEASD